MTLEEAIAHIENRFPSKMGQPAAFCETGEEYIQISSSGPVHEGSSHTLYPTTEEAVGNWLDAVSDYAKDKTGTLYWRIRPELIRIPGHNGYYVYSRLIVTDKPMLPKGHHRLIDWEAANRPSAAAERIEAQARKICRHLGHDPDTLVMRGHPTQVGGAPAGTFFQLPVFPLWESFVDYVLDEENP